MEFKNPIQITNWSIGANAYRNIRRLEVDKLFTESERLKTKSNDYKYRKLEKQAERALSSSKEINNSARQLWREIITISNNII